MIHSELTLYSLGENKIIVAQQRLITIYTIYIYLNQALFSICAGCGILVSMITGLSPNASRDDVRLAFKLRFSPSLRRAASGSRVVLEEKFRQHLSMSNVFAFDSGRTSLYAILSSLDLPSGSEVLLQAYTCVAVPEPVLWANLKPVYVDINEDLTMDAADLEKKITSKSRVLIIQHTFGMPADVDGLVAVARKHNLFVIEDCAHALGARYKEKKAGTLCDASFFSLGRDKIISAVFGGVAAVKNPDLAGKIKALQNSYSDSPLPWVKKQLNHPIIFFLANPLYDFADIGKFLIEVSKRLNIFSKAVEKTELSGGKPSFAFHRMSDALAALGLNQFAQLERLNAHRAKLAAIYDAALFPTWAGIASRGIPQDRASANLRYTLFVPSPKNLARHMKERGVLLGDWYDTGIAPKDVAYEKIGYDPKSCPKAEALALRSINLPTNIHVSEEDAQKIASEIKEYLNGNQRD